MILYSSTTQKNTSLLQPFLYFMGLLQMCTMFFEKVKYLIFSRATFSLFAHLGIRAGRSLVCAYTGSASAHTCLPELPEKINAVKERPHTYIRL